MCALSEAVNRFSKVNAMNFRLKLRALFLFPLLLYASACDPKGGKPPVSTTRPVSAALPAGETVALTIVGFNYTNEEINDFYVDGTGGGNLYVSSASGGGGGSACCASYTIGTPAPEIELRWQSDACTYNSRVGTNGRIFNDIHSFYKKEIVKVNARVPKNPHYLEIHIFSDRPAQAFITEDLSRPKVALDQNRRVNTPFRKCPDDAKPIN